MSNASLKKLVDFIDDYATEYKKNSQTEQMNFSLLSIMINQHYMSERLYDASFVGINHAPKIYYYPPQGFYNPYLYSQTKILDGEIHPKQLQQQQQLQLQLQQQQQLQLQQQQQLQQLQQLDYYSYFSNSSWNNSNDLYSNWQKEHEVNPIINNPQKSTLLSTRLFIETEKEQVFIDASMQSLTDIISIIKKNDYNASCEYNIDLKSLHNIKDELIELNNMIGMETLKKSVLEQLVYFSQELHLGDNISDFKHTVIYGPPGTGKTEIAKIVGKMYSKLGILKNKIFKKVTRSDLVAGYLGQTAIKTNKVITEALGGVLFIDEAYSLASKQDNDIYSKECIDTLCEALSDHKNDLMVIIAGYEDELNDTFFRINRGMESRFIWRFKIDEYSSKELMSIFKKKVREQEWAFENEDSIKEKWFNEKKSKFKGYGRDMELLLLYVKIAHGKRIYGKSKDLRKKITLDDMNNGFETFEKNKNIKTEPEYLKSIYM
jgi:SpoVK/Ycf46/Vps4 family AAA+-type ATPase